MKQKNNDLALKANEFIELVKGFEHQLEVDPFWDIIFNNQKRKWYHLRVSMYNDIYYVNDILSGEGIEIEPAKNRVEASDSFSAHNYFSPSKWLTLLDIANEWLKKAKMDWLSVYQFVVQKYPLDNRTGIVSSAIVKHYFPEYNYLLQELGVKNAKSMCEIVEGKKLMNYDAGIRTTMTANTFFDYCKIAYCTLNDDNNKFSGKELYKKYADGRDEGLLDINPDSEQEFADWIDDKHPKKSKGGHPWEIRRGGNTSNIQLTIRRPHYRDKTSFSIEIYPTGNSRLAETIKMFLAIYEAGLPITISKYDFIRDQLLGFDNFGIMPQYQSLHRATQSFSEEKKVSNVLYLSNLKEHLSKIRPLISWEALPILKPKLA